MADDFYRRQREYFASRPDSDEEDDDDIPVVVATAEPSTADKKDKKLFSSVVGKSTTAKSSSASGSSAKEAIALDDSDDDAAFARKPAAAESGRGRGRGRGRGGGRGAGRNAAGGGRSSDDERGGEKIEDILASLQETLGGGGSDDDDIAGAGKKRRRRGAAADAAATDRVVPGIDTSVVDAFKKSRMAAQEKLKATKRSIEVLKSTPSEELFAKEAMEEARAARAADGAAAADKGPGVAHIRLVSAPETGRKPIIIKMRPDQPFESVYDAIANKFSIKALDDFQLMFEGQVIKPEATPATQDIDVYHAQEDNVAHIDIVLKKQSATKPQAVAPPQAARTASSATPQAPVVVRLRIVFPPHLRLKNFLLNMGAEQQFNSVSALLTGKYGIPDFDLLYDGETINVTDTPAALGIQPYDGREENVAVINVEAD